MKKGMILKLMTVVAVFTIFFFIGTSSDTPDVIYWSEEHPLTWEDFAGDPKYNYRNRDIAALTSSGIVHYRGCQDGKITFKVRAYFEVKESWVKEVARTNYHLAHEQLHFDVTELHARKLRKLLEEQNFRCGEEEQFERYIKQYLHNWEVTQQVYDFSTHHSVNKEEQKNWHHKIAFELSLLDDYKE